MDAARQAGEDVERTVPSASVLKPMLLVAYLRRPAVRHRRLTRAERALLGPMIRRSDNAAASRVCNIVGTGGLARLAGRVQCTASTPPGHEGSHRST